MSYAKCFFFAYETILAAALYQCHSPFAIWKMALAQARKFSFPPALNDNQVVTLNNE
jgi:hypothetical protein